MKHPLTSVTKQDSFYAAVVVLVTFAAFPFYWMLLTAFKSDADLYNLKSNPYWFNAAPTSITFVTSLAIRFSCNGCGTAFLLGYAWSRSR